MLFPCLEYTLAASTLYFSLKTWFGFIGEARMLQLMILVSVVTYQKYTVDDCMVFYCLLSYTIESSL